MTHRLPGVRLHRLLSRCAPTVVVRDVLEPAIADLQYEAEHAPTMRERRHVIRRGHVAVLRALMLSIEPGGMIRAALALSVLCALGTMLVTSARAAHVDGRVMSSALLAPGMSAPVLLRVLGTTSARRLFLGSLLVSMLTPAFAHALGALTSLVLFAPLAAVTALIVGPGRETLPRRGVAAASLGSSIATAALLISRRPDGQHLAIVLAMTPFYVALFAALFGVTLLPILLVARPLIAHPALLAIAGAICSPAPLIAAAYLDHRTLGACLDALRQTPFSFAVSSLPFVTGSIAVGWSLCGTIPRGPCPPEV